MTDSSSRIGTAKMMWWIVGTLWAVVMLFGGILINQSVENGEIARDAELTNVRQDEQIKATERQLARIEEKIDRLLIREYGYVPAIPSALSQ